MQRLSLAILLTLPIAVAIAWSLGGALGGGVLMGFFVGSALSGFGVAWLLHVMRTQPQRLIAAFGVGFLCKLFVALAGGLVFRFVEPAAARVDHRSFLLAFACMALLLLLVGASSTARALREAAAARSLVSSSNPGLAADEGTRP